MHRVVLVTGQSLAIGTDGGPALTTSVEYAGQSLKYSGTAVAGSVESSVETVVSQLVGGLVEAYVAAGDASAKVVGYTSGKGGTPYALIKKRGTDNDETFGKLMAAVGQIEKLVADNLEVVSAHIIHGESDANINTTTGTYVRYLREWVRDLDIDARGRTGQTARVRSFGCQVSSWRLYQTTPTIALAQIAAHRDPSIDFTLVGPKYQLPYFGGGTGSPHLSNVGYYKLAELHARAAKRVLIDGWPWQPVHPKSVTISGSTITAKFHVPVGPLQFDTTTVSAQTNMGFVAYDDGVEAAISSVTLTDHETVTVALSSAPSGTVALGYAYKGGALTTNWPFGNLCDSDPSVSGYDGEPLRNWCVCFLDTAVPS